MSLGPGWVQRKILEALEDVPYCFLLDMVLYIFKTENPTNSQYKSVARAVKRLEEQGIIGSKIYHWRSIDVWKMWNLNSVKTDYKNYPSRKNYPKWSKIIWLKISVES